MKKSSIWKLLFSALTVFAVAVFAGCTDDNDDMGAPYLNITAGEPDVRCGGTARR